MARLGTRQQIALLVAAASVPVSLGLSAWPPAHVHELVIVHEPVAVRVEVPVAAVEAEVPPAPPAPPRVVELVEARAQPAGFVYGRDFLWVASDVDGGSPFAVLSVEPDEAWGKGRPRPTADEGRVERTVDEAAVPAELRALVGERVVLDTGAFCTAVVGPMRLVSQSEGDFDLMVDGLELDEEQIDEATGWDPRPIWERVDAEDRERLAAAMWDGGRRLLVAPLELGEACDDRGQPRWARPVGRGDVARLEVGSMRKRGALVRRFLARPELVELSREFDEYVAMMAESEAEAAASTGEAAAVEPTTPARLPRLSDRVKAWQWRTAEGTPAFVVMATEGEELQPEPCSGIPVPLWAIAPVAADGTTGSFMVGPYGDPSALFDLDGDGRWELLLEPDSYFTEPQLLTIGPEGFTALTTLPTVPYHGCPC
jgi:hypothetical protein